jgi:amino acid transporter
MVGVAFIVVVLIVVPDRHQSLSYVFTETVNNSGFGGGTTSWSSPTFWFVWGLGLLLAQYTITGFDASAHTAEETNQASRMAATGMWTSVVASVFFGWILLLAVTFAIPSTDGALENIGAVVPWIWAESMSQSWAEALLFICVIAQFFCLTASVTSASRMMFAFSRDGAVPGHQLWRRVANNRIPRYSVAGIGFFSAVLMIPAVWNYLVGYFVGTAIAVIGLYIAFVIPVYLRLRKGDSWDAPRAWTLGRHYKWIDIVSLVWVAFITILFIFPLYQAGLPWSDDFTWELTNYTILWFVGIGIIFGGWWFLSAKHWFKGPVRMGTEEELEAMEEEIAKRTGVPATGQTFGS